jgi:hypothetical protein
MIDLNCTKEHMLAEIKASAKAFANCLHDAADPDFVTLEEVCLIVHGKTPDELLPVLSAAFSERYANVPEQQLHRDLLYPLKKALGNAYKWGNRKDLARQITVETVATKAGILVAISDEGEGFDVQGILGQFCRGERHYTHGGSGFRHFAKARSLISYASGGRMLLLCCVGVAESGSAMTAAPGAAFGAAGEAEFMRSFLSTELPYFRQQNATLHSCRIYVPDQQAHQPEIKYLVAYHTGESKQEQKLLLTGRLLPEGAAQTDFSVAEQLYKGPFRGKKDLCIPKPMAVFQQPPLVLFEFNPTIDLKRYVKKSVTFPEVAQVIKMVAEALRALHQSVIALEVEEDVADVLHRHQTVRDRIITKLAQANPQWVELVQQLFNHLMERALGLNSCELVPIHGAFAWHCIVYDDRQFYLYRFEACRRSHPGFDIGGFLADLLCFYGLSKKSDQGSYETGRAVFLETYFAGKPPLWQEDVSFFVVSALLQRLDWLMELPEEKWQPKIASLLELSAPLWRAAN